MRYFAFLSFAVFISGLTAVSAQEPGVNKPASIRPVSEISPVSEIIRPVSEIRHVGDATFDLLEFESLNNDAPCATCGDADCGSAACDSCGCARWNPRRELYPRYPYTAWPMTYYYFRPYNHRHVLRQQQDALEWGAPSEMPYSRDVFESIYKEFEKAK